MSMHATRIYYNGANTTYTAYVSYKFGYHILFWYSVTRKFMLKIPKHVKGVLSEFVVKTFLTGVQFENHRVTL